MPLVQFYDQTIDNEGRPVPARVTVYRRGTTTEADDAVFSQHSGGAQSNPFDAPSGIIQFWASPGAYDVKIEDVTNTPPRFATRTVGFDAISADTKGVELFQLGDSILRQIVPVGTVIDWWRPVTPAGGTPVPVPTGFEVCDGRSIATGNHDFPISGGITLPDLRNKFILGADVTKADETGGTNAEGATNAPGIRGVGGSNAAKNLTHTHTVPAHYHGRGTLNTTGFDVYNTDINHTHGNTGGHSTSHWHGINNQGSGTYVTADTAYFAGGSSVGPFGRRTLGTDGADRDHVHGTGWMDRSNSHDHGGTVGLTGDIGATGSGRNGDTGITSEQASANITTNHDMRPSYYGLLKIMKVRRS